MKCRLMRNAFVVFILLLILASFPSCNDCNQYITTDQRLFHYVFKAGSYFVYIDSAENIIDSDYVIQYTYVPNGTPLTHVDDCYTYGNALGMEQVSYRNNIFYDNYFYNASPTDIVLIDTKGYDYYRSTIFNPSLDTVSIHNFPVGGNIVPVIYKGESAIILEGSNNVNTDFYLAPDYGIVKKVEHRATGDVIWNLIRYHIVH